MEVKKFLDESGKQIDSFLDEFFTQEEKRAGSFSPDCALMVTRFRRYMRGGKMARGGLVQLGYLIGGGKNQEAIVAAAAAIEVFHSFLLVHDDWIDKDERRRGKPTIHVQYEKDFDRLGQPGEKLRWAGGMAFILGDVGCFWATKILTEADFPPERLVKTISLLTDSLVKTGYGEILDIGYDLQDGWDWEKILQIRELKTAYYTLVMPLQVGLSLAGAGEKKMKAAVDYGRSVGIGFQLHDDYLGLFGDETKTGKSAS
ncbi:polyprenyl synthetase family protein, partial [Patescibacteria group bacterium]|nr:polyprenyl synthetase family protein [Patescibacteria group bacterium]